RPLRGLLISYPFFLRSNGTGFMLILRLENASGSPPESMSGMRTRCFSRSGLQLESLLRDRFHLCARIEDRKISPARPKRIQIAVVRAIHITRLAWIVQSDRV